MEHATTVSTKTFISNLVGGVQTASLQYDSSSYASRHP